MSEPYSEYELSAKILANILVDGNDCWIWQKSRDGNGYGMIWLGHKNGKSHIASYLVFGGFIPSGMILRHECDNPPCCNPLHLKPGTHKQNAEDCKERGRMGNRGRKPERWSPKTENRISIKLQTENR